MKLVHRDKEESVSYKKGFDPKVVGRYHREMFRLHDLESWDDLKKTAREMIVELGYNMEAAEKASEFVMLAYRDADHAAEAQKAGKSVEERKAYNDMLANFVLANESLSSEIHSLKYKKGWHEAARHNRPFQVAYNLFREHLERFGILRFDVVISTTWVAFFGAYFAHKKHDWKRLERMMAKYWRHVHRAYHIRPPIQI